MAEVTRVKVELQEQIGHLQAERTAQSGLKEKIAALEREMKGKGSQLKYYRLSNSAYTKEQVFVLK